MMPAPAAVRHAFDHLARDVEHAVQVGVITSYQSLSDMRLEHAVAGDAGVVDQDIDRPD